MNYHNKYATPQPSPWESKLAAAYAEGRKDEREAADATIAELLEALKFMLSEFSVISALPGHKDEFAACEAARAAIQSAEGTKP